VPGPGPGDHAGRQQNVREGPPHPPGRFTHVTSRRPCHRESHQHGSDRGTTVAGRGFRLRDMVEGAGHRGHRTTRPRQVVLSAASDDPTYGHLPCKSLELENLDGAAFAGIGLLAGDASSAASGVNADGRVVVGYGASASGGQAIRWTPETGLASLGGLASAAQAVNGSGDIIVGVAQDSDGNRAAARWVNGVGPELLRLSPQFDGMNSGANGISGNGQVAVGRASQRKGPLDPIGIAWIGANPIGRHQDGFSVVSGANEDGNVLVGYVLTGRGMGWDVAVRNGKTLPFPASWLCLVPPNCSARALAVSRDGTVTVGSATNDQGSVAVSWTVGADGNVTTTVLSSSEVPSEASATSRDGRVVVGYDGGATR
jgi:uncharacterized membrane protein